MENPELIEIAKTIDSIMYLIYTKKKVKSKNYLKCEHGVYEENCVKCIPELQCIHIKRKNKCIICTPNLQCPHGKSKYRCKKCPRIRPALWKIDAAN